MKGGRSRVLHRHGRLVHPWAPPGPREHRGRLSPGRCARRTRGGEGAAFFGSFWCASQQGTCTLAERIRGVYRARGGGEVSGASVHLPGPRPSTARARSIAHRRRYALLCQMRGASVLMRRRVKAQGETADRCRCAHVHNMGSFSPIFTLELRADAPRRADSSAHDAQHDGGPKQVI